MPDVWIIIHPELDRIDEWNNTQMSYLWLTSPCAFGELANQSMVQSDNMGFYVMYGVTFL
jgi:hypothetical protein